MSRFRKIITIFVLVIAVIIAVFEFYRTIAYVFTASQNQQYSGYLWLSVGFLVYLFAHRFIFRKNIDIMQTMSHEGAHMFVGALFLRRKIYQFNAKSSDSLSYGDHFSAARSIAGFPTSVQFPRASQPLIWNPRSISRGKRSFAKSNLVFSGM